MNLFAINILLAVIWVLLNGAFTLPALITGYVLGLGALWLARPLYTSEGTYFVQGWRIIQLAVYFFYELILSSFKVAGNVLTPGDRSTPQIVEMPLDVTSDLEILLVSNLISLTPGTLSLDVSKDRSVLYVHAMFADDPDATVRELKSGMEHMVRRVFTA